MLTIYPIINPTANCLIMTIFQRRNRSRNKPGTLLKKGLINRNKMRVSWKRRRKQSATNRKSPSSGFLRIRRASSRRESFIFRPSISMGILELRQVHLTRERNIPGSSLPISLTAPKSNMTYTNLTINCWPWTSRTSVRPRTISYLRTIPSMTVARIWRVSSMPDRCLMEMLLSGHSTPSWGTTSFLHRPSTLPDRSNSALTFEEISTSNCTRIKTTSPSSHDQESLGLPIPRKLRTFSLITNGLSRRCQTIDK